MTIEAIGCQFAIADKIVEHQADYLLALKATNQPWKTEGADWEGIIDLSKALMKGVSRMMLNTLGSTLFVQNVFHSGSWPRQCLTK